MKSPSALSSKMPSAVLPEIVLPWIMFPVLEFTMETPRAFGRAVVWVELSPMILSLTVLVGEALISIPGPPILPEMMLVNPAPPMVLPVALLVRRIPPLVLPSPEASLLFVPI